MPDPSVRECREVRDRLCGWQGVPESDGEKVEVQRPADAAEGIVCGGWWQRGHGLSPYRRKKDLTSRIQTGVLFSDSHADTTTQSYGSCSRPNSKTRDGPVANYPLST